MSDTQEKDEQTNAEEERKAAADAQNLTAENAVPEQRPQAFLEPNPGDDVSDLTKRLQEAGDPAVGVDEPMPQEAYDKAASEAQMKKAEKSSKSEGLMVGNVAVATKGPHEGRHIAVTRIITEGSVADSVRRLSGSPEQVLNSPKEIEGTAIGDERDGERLILDVEEHGLVKQNESYRGTRAGRRH